MFEAVEKAVEAEHQGILQANLDELMAAYNAALRKARVAMVAWSWAHQRLAAGMTDPAKIDVLGLAQKAVGAAF